MLKTAWKDFKATVGILPIDASLETIFWKNLFSGSTMWRANEPPCSSIEEWVALYELFLMMVDGKRQRQNGIYYTPQPIAFYIVQRTLGNVLAQQIASLYQAMSEKKIEKATTVIQQVKAIRVIDPACGTGIFLLEAFKQLSSFYQEAQCLYQAADIQKTPEIPSASDVILHQLYGVDSDAVAINLASMRLQEWLHRLDKVSIDKTYVFENVYPANLKTADTLAEETLFSEIASWDFILGNPPYVSEVRKQAGLFRSLQARKNGYYQAKMDLCDAFLAWSLQSVNPGGQLGFVLPEYWMQRSSTKQLRQKLWEVGGFQEYWHFGESKQFDCAPGHHSSILIWKKTRNAQDSPIDTSGISRMIQFGDGSQHSLGDTALKSGSILLDASSGKLVVGNSQQVAVLEKLNLSPPLFQREQIQQGIVLPQGRLKKADWKRLTETYIQESLVQDTGVFLLTSDEVAALNLNVAETAWLKPYYLPGKFSAFQGFTQHEPDYWLLYGDIENRKKLTEHPETYPQLKAHLDRFRTINTSAFAPYGLHRPRQACWFEPGTKILSPRQVMRPQFAAVPQAAYVNEAFYIIDLLKSMPQQVQAYTAILNSTVAWFWFYHQKRKGHRLQIDKDVLTVFPCPKNLDSAMIESLAEFSQSLAQTFCYQTWQMLNVQVFHCYGLKAGECDVLLEWAKQRGEAWST